MIDFSEILPGISEGQRFGPYPFRVSADENEQILFATRDYNPIYREGNDGRPPVAHPGALLNATMVGVMKFHSGPGWTGLHARDESEWSHAAFVDEELEFEMGTIQLLEKRGRPVWIREYWIRAAGGGHLKLRRRIHTAFIRNVTG